MADSLPRRAHTLPVAEAARWLGVDVAALRVMAKAGYLDIGASDEVTLVEVKAFIARNAEGGSGASMGAAVESTNLQALVDALDQRVEQLADHAFTVFARVLPEAATWPNEQRESFVQQARGRFSAVLAVVSQTTDVDDALRRDLEEVGRNAAWAGSSLPHLLLVLRISRDVLVQMAMKLASERQGRWDTNLDAFTARILPAIDRLTDAMTSGYWEATGQRETEIHARATAIVERCPWGVYEADLDGLVQYTNEAFASLVGRSRDQLDGLPLGEVLRPLGPGSVSALLAEPEDDVNQVTFAIAGDGGEGEVMLEIDTLVRRSGESVAGFAGIVRPLQHSSARVDLTALIRHIYELRRSLDILGEAGAFLGRHAGELGPDQVEQAGESIRRQALRLVTIVEELDADRKAIQPPVV